MQTSINLQAPFTYSIIPLIMVIILIIGVVLYYIYSQKTKKQNNQEDNEVKEIPEINVRDIPVIKKKHLDRLKEIEDQYNNNKIDLRKAYQLISECIRLFVFEVTNITTQNYSLAEIKRLNIPQLYELIKEYYEPEFASKSEGDFKSSINKARRVINEWK